MEGKSKESMLVRMGTPSTGEGLGSERCRSGTCHLLLFLPTASFLCRLPISVSFLSLLSFFLPGGLLAVPLLHFLSVSHSSKKICDTPREQTSFQGSQRALTPTVTYFLPLPSPPRLCLCSLSVPPPFSVFLSLHLHPAGSSPLDFHTISYGRRGTKGFLGSAGIRDWVGSRVEVSSLPSPS